MTRVDLLYRGPLSSCNYDCAYCPFAKNVSTREELAADRSALDRFVRFVAAQRRPIGVLFTPWGEALIRAHYRDAIATLSRLDHVERVAIQTNLSCDLRWLERADVRRVALWATFHPSEADEDAFVAKCAELDRLGVRHSVGIVGLREHVAIATRLRARLSPSTYLWVNAYKSGSAGYYDRASFDALGAIDALFPINAVRHASLGESCRTGASVFSVDGGGDVRRCHFVDRVIGNVYRDELDEIAGERACPNETCGCHIGYVHLDRLGLYDVFGEGVLERVPARLPVLNVSNSR
jgi:MoaA/NifB/PqqE/SkfB family radical SAM enzyme